jgi:hypothetical protein
MRRRTATKMPRRAQTTAAQNAKKRREEREDCCKGGKEPLQKTRGISDHGARNLPDVLAIEVLIEVLRGGLI